MLSFKEAVRVFGRKKIFSPLDSDENTAIVNDLCDIRLGNNPAEGELEFFYSFSSFVWLQLDPDCQDALVNLAALRLQAGDVVEVVGKSEPLWNVRGAITAVERNVATVQIDTFELQDSVAIPLVVLRAAYEVGHYIKVVQKRLTVEHRSVVPSPASF
ncbi:hypothetical protein H0H92_008803, partial [Tricholoma furcatifolium]